MICLIVGTMGRFSFCSNNKYNNDIIKKEKILVNIDVMDRTNRHRLLCLTFGVLREDTV